MPSDPYRLGLSVTHADGRVTRWGADELAAQDIPTGLSFSTTIPGGFKDCSCSLLRRVDLDYADEALFDSVRVYGPGNETAWEGRMAQLPRQHGDQFSVTPGAVGWSAHLQDDPSFREIYVDRDLSHWGDPSVQRKINLLSGATFSPNWSPSVVQDPSAGQAALQIAVDGDWAGSKPICEALYDSQGIPLSALSYAWKIGATVNSADANWNWSVVLGDTDVFTTSDTSGNLRAAGPSAGGVTATADRRAAAVQIYYNTIPSTGHQSTQYPVYWTLLAVYGANSVVTHGTLSATDAPGFYASEVIADIVGRAAPLLNFTTGADGSISPTTFVIPHLVFMDPTTASDAISLINGYHLYEWGVYDNRTFFWRPPDPDRLTWTCRLSDGAQVSLEGDDANNIFNGVFATFTDPSGKKKTVGPPGSGADTEDASLVDTDPANPVNAHGIPRRWGKLDVSQTTTAAGAVQLGAVWLAEHRLPARRGQLTLTGTADHPTQGKRPVWAIRAGDYITIADRPNDPPRRIIETSYSHDSRQATLSLDQTVFKIEALMERLGAGLVGVI